MTGERTESVWQGRVRIRVRTAGSGPPLVFFHGSWGLDWDPFLDALARRYTVVAPEHPGTTPGAPDDVYHLDGLWDLVLCYDELLATLGIERAALVGHSFGGMVACEVAATFPRRATHLALIAPIGLWRDADPVVNWALLTPDALRARLFHDLDGTAARRLVPSGDADGAVDARVRLTWAMGATGKFTWPIPDEGLGKRLHRVTAPALLVWGADDRLVPRAYAAEFARRLPVARVEMVERAGHAPHWEHPEAVARLVADFLGAAEGAPRADGRGAAAS